MPIGRILKKRKKKNELAFDTVYLRSFDQIYTVTKFKKWVKTFWTDSTYYTYEFCLFSLNITKHLLCV